MTFFFMFLTTLIVICGLNLLISILGSTWENFKNNEKNKERQDNLSLVVELELIKYGMQRIFSLGNETDYKLVGEIYVAFD